MSVHFLRLQQVQERTKLSRAHIYALIKDGKFPAPVKLSKRASGWVDSEIDEWQLSKIEERDGEVSA